MNPEYFDVKEARAIADELRVDLADLCEQGVVAGSIRRWVRYVKDAEIVVLPKNAPTLLARLDSWLIAGQVKKALYNNSGERWGTKYRGLIYKGLRVEIFIGDSDNFGYLLWLRTGPSEANKYVMQQCIYQAAPYRAEGGYWWKDGRKLSIPDEPEMFRLLGMMPILPHLRSIDAYHKFMSPARWASSVNYAIVPELPVQGTLL
jgi:DNA polymerase/3'-5' exonuclease PolX